MRTVNMSDKLWEEWQAQSATLGRVRAAAAKVPDWVTNEDWDWDHYDQEHCMHVLFKILDALKEAP